MGVLLVQLARLAGERVIGTASPAKHNGLRALGAELLDYLGGPSLHDSWPLLAPGGTQR